MANTSISFKKKKERNKIQAVLQCKFNLDDFAQLYTQVKRELEVVAKHREDNDFQDPEVSFNIPSREDIEALRICGSAEYGFGTLPSIIGLLLTRTGMCFLAIDDSVVKVPLYWHEYYRILEGLTADNADAFPHDYVSVTRPIHREVNVAPVPSLSEERGRVHGSMTVHRESEFELSWRVGVAHDIIHCLEDIDECLSKRRNEVLDLVLTMSIVGSVCAFGDVRDGLEHDNVVRGASGDMAT
ncbi:hypothetical protein F5Y10DRAFT_261963 [Nemania abortiva]|nr:hypothetical protein F5Y10DRAFT_261963 [Nemania abortiva]